MDIPTTYIIGEGQVKTFIAMTLISCLLIALAVYILLPKKIPIHKKIIASAFIFIGLYGLFSILLKTILALISS